MSQIIIEEMEEGESQYTTWRDILILADLACCVGIMWPTGSSICRLRNSSQTVGLGAVKLAKLKIFRLFFILVPTYLT